ncbi:hypothetical protein CR513_06957, partial [Mucuna pruriens]
MIHASPWYGNICNYLVASTYLRGASQPTKDKLSSDAKYYVQDDPSHAGLKSVSISAQKDHPGPVEAENITTQANDLGSWKLPEVIARYSRRTPMDENLNAWPSLVHHCRSSIGDRHGKRTL